MEDFNTKLSVLVNKFINQELKRVEIPLFLYGSETRAEKDIGKFQINRNEVFLKWNNFNTNQQKKLLSLIKEWMQSYFHISDFELEFMLSDSVVSDSKVYLILENDMSLLKKIGRYPRYNSTIIYKTNDATLYKLTLKLDLDDAIFLFKDKKFIKGENLPAAMTIQTIINLLEFRGSFMGQFLIKFSDSDYKKISPDMYFLLREKNVI